MEEFKPSETFPFRHLFVLATVLFASAVSWSGLFPYVGFMVVKLHMAGNHVTETHNLRFLNL